MTNPLKYEQGNVILNWPKTLRGRNKFASMRHLAGLAEKLEKDPSLRQCFEKLKCVWDSASHSYTNLPQWLVRPPLIEELHPRSTPSACNNPE